MASERCTSTTCGPRELQIRTNNHSSCTPMRVCFRHCRVWKMTARESSVTMSSVVVTIADLKLPWSLFRALFLRWKISGVVKRIQMLAPTTRLISMPMQHSCGSASQNLHMTSPSWTRISENRRSDVAQFDHCLHRCIIRSTASSRQPLSKRVNLQWISICAVLLDIHDSGRMDVAVADQGIFLPEQANFAGPSILDFIQTREGNEHDIRG